ncbi:MAG TPA: hypothetical protein VFV34_19060 [Blastocatellia bacterium]|nr:hypothetical protein [Blastocatellia bacterium]
MTAALWLLAIQGVVGAFDTVYYHEWRAQLPGRVPDVAAELKLHAARDFLYAVIFGTLPWIAWQGLWVAALSAVLVAEIVLTLADFVTEARVRKAIGDVYPGERVTHAAMGICYGAMLANLIPVLINWSSLPTGLAASHPAVPDLLRWSLTIMAAGVFASGIRDLYASLGLPYSHWPWSRRDLET